MRTLIIPMRATLSQYAPLAGIALNPVEVVRDLLAMLPMLTESNWEVRHAYLEKLLPRIRDYPSHKRAVEALDAFASDMVSALIPFLTREGFLSPQLPTLSLNRLLPDAWVVSIIEEPQ